MVVSVLYSGPRPAFPSPPYLSLILSVPLVVWCHILTTFGMQVESGALYWVVPTWLHQYIQSRE